MVRDALRNTAVLVSFLLTSSTRQFRLSLQRFVFNNARGTGAYRLVSRLLHFQRPFDDPTSASRTLVVHDRANHAQRHHWTWSTLQELLMLRERH